MSAYVSDYTFNNLSRIGEDGCSLGQRGIQNVEASNYMLQNFFSDDCTMKRPIEFATSQPSINYTGGHQVGAGGCNIDTNSQLLIGGSALTHPRCRISLHRIETREQLGGYFLIDVPDLDAALGWAARCPGASHGSVEVRPVWPTGSQ